MHASMELISILTMYCRRNSNHPRQLIAVMYPDLFASVHQSISNQVFDE
jgi:hypothetical protein